MSLKRFFSVLHLIIRSINKNFESFKELYSTINFKLSIVCFFRNMGKNINLNTIYRPPNCDMKQCETHSKDVFSKNGQKNIVLAGDFHINFLDFEANKNVQDLSHISL